MYKTGVVIGKFYPPHRGHRFLIDTATQNVDHLTVLACADPRQTIPADLRVRWLQELHPTVDVRLIPDIGKDDDSQAWAEYTRQFLGWAPEVVFSSEEYGPRYATLMGSQHVMVDQQRQTVPMSATKVRRDPIENWTAIESCVRGFLAKRICILGAESTGTTTLSKDVAAAYRTVWVPEYGRTYSEEKYQDNPNPVWTTDEFVFIAKEQLRQEDDAARQANRVLICDTNAFATGLWHERYMGSRSSLVERVGRERLPDLYLLTNDNIPFVQDGLRDGEHIRHWMHGLFVKRLNQQSVPWKLVTGTPTERLAQAQQEIDRVLATMPMETTPNYRR